MSAATLPNSTGTEVPLKHDAWIIALVGVAHGISHFSQLVLPPLFPWLKDALAVSYTQLGFLMTVFFVVSCIVQTASGFVVDKLGPRPVLFAGLGLLGLAAVGYATSPSYAVMAFWAAVAGVGNGVFHPVDYTLLNRKVSQPRLGHAYSMHGITGNLGWALAPAMVVPLALAFSWRVAAAAAGALAWLVLVLLVLHRSRLHLPPAVAATPHTAGVAAGQGKFDFLRIPAVWMCFGFFFLFAMALSVIQAFAPQAARYLHDMPVSLVATCLTAYMLASATGMVAGGFLTRDPNTCERNVATGFGLAACFALAVALLPVPGVWVPVLFAGMGLVTGSAGPARDMLVKRSTPENASGRVYGVVYSGLDIGQAVAPLVFGRLMDHGAYQGVLLGLALLQGVIVGTAFNVRRVRRA